SPPFWRKTGALALCQKVFSTNKQVAERGQQMQPVVVLGQAAIANFAVAKDLLYVPEWMLDLGTNAGFDFLGFKLFSIQRFSCPRARSDVPRYVLAVLMFRPLLNTEVAGIAENPLLFTMQQLVRGHNVVHVGSGGINTVDQAQRVIDADVHLHSEAPLIALLGLMHFRITLAGLVLGGTRCRNDGGIDNAAFTQHQAVFLKMLIHFFEQYLAKAMLLQKMAELKNGGFVRQTIQLQSSKLAH